MPTTYAEADHEVYRLMGDVLDEHFASLKALEPELSITVLMATNYRSAAIKFAGAAAAAKIKIVGPEERSNGGPDLRILVDSRRWEELADRGKRALLHHELNHVEPRYDRKSGVLKLDPYGRPVVKLRPDDWVLTGFEATVEAYGADALEHGAVVRTHESLRQLVMPFVEAPADQPRAGGDLVTHQAGAWHDDGPDARPKRQARKGKPRPAKAAHA